MLKMILEDFIVPENKEVLKQITKYNYGNISKGYKNQMKELPMAKAGTVSATMKVILDHTVKY